MNHECLLLGARWLGQVLILSSSLAAVAAETAVPSLTAGELQLTLRTTEQGVTFDRLTDLTFRRELLAAKPPPLFTLVLRQTNSSQEVRLSAESGWRHCEVKPQANRLELVWSDPVDESQRDLSVIASVTADRRQNALHWRFRVDNRSQSWSVWRAIFPQLELASLGKDAAIFFPRGPGEIQRGRPERGLNYRGQYPSGDCTMQYLAAYTGGDQPSGLYVGVHDPWGSTKDLRVALDPAADTIRLAFEHPAPNMGLPGNSFALEGAAVWQLLRGDWFDAATTYRHWAQAEAKWWPRRGVDGRKDTPRWMRELSVWALSGGAPDDCVPWVKEFREYVGLPVAVHWYNWHQIPFDNDYPHYFPTKDHFAQGVAQLRAAGVFTMPYINGRLWDSHDRGAEDFEFTARALPWVTKQPDGSPYLEKYGSKETNGQPVSLGVMCPSTSFWQNTVSNIVLRLLRECGTAAVYVDQVAAAAPKLCMDRSHGHPLGGGHWWTEGYWKMFEQIRRVKPPESMLTTECNSEPFIRWFDGYLTWHWQHDGQVPAFPAVYGGTLQMFGRAYRGGESKDLALRMKAGQQLVFGEQLGWLDPGVVHEPENARFFREMAQLRSQFNRFFYAGEMARPPRLRGQVPRVKADWQWNNVWYVTTDAILTGAWRLPREHRLVLFFVNVSDSPVQGTIEPSPEDWGLPIGRGRAHLTSFGLTPIQPQDFGIGQRVTFPARQAVALEIAW